MFFIYLLWTNKVLHTLDADRTHQQTSHHPRRDYHLLLHHLCPEHLTLLWCKTHSCGWRKDTIPEFNTSNQGSVSNVTTFQCKSKNSIWKLLSAGDLFTSIHETNIGGEESKSRILRTSVELVTQFFLNVSRETIIFKRYFYVNTFVF